MSTKYQCKINTKTGNLMTCEFRVAGPFNFFRPKEQDNGAEKFGFRALFPKGADLGLLKQLVEDAAEEKFGKSWKSKGLKMPFRNQGEKADYEGFEDGAIFVNLSAWEQPGLVDEAGVPIISQDEFKPGYWARASVQAYGYDANGNRGVGLKVVNVQKLWEDEVLAGGGSPRAEDEFEAVGGSSAETAEEGSSLDDLLG